MKRALGILLSLSLVISLVGCDWLLEEDYEESEYIEEDYSEEDYSDNEGLSDHVPVENTGTDWVIYWYLCGSDLETYGGFASTDLYEMMEVQLPEGVQVVIQTGGAYSWYNDFVDPNYTERYLFDSEGLQFIEQIPVANMGETQTLVDFLNFAETNYPGDRTMLNFWNHGGGTVTGAAFDELFDNDSLTLDEMYTALDMVYGGEPEYYPLDIVGFDTCLMATLTTAYTFSDHANYLVASQELEPGGGWYYTGIMQALADNSTISPYDLSVAICDTYVEGCEYEGTADDITLSVTDLSAIDPILTAYEEFGVEALDYALDDPSFFTHFAQVANEAENYGYNSREHGYTNMVDMGQLVYNVGDLFPDSSEALIEAIEDAVVYRIDSLYRPDGMGLSTYYTYDGDHDNLASFAELHPVNSMDYLYMYGLTGYLDDTGYTYLEEALSYTEETLPELVTLDTVDADWSNLPITFDEDGLSVIELGPEAYDTLVSIAFELYYSPFEDEELLITLGSDNDITGDYDTGVFTDNFRGVWGHLDGELCYMELVYEADDYNEYAVPIYINDEEFVLTVIYHYDNEEFVIIGARRPITQEGAADKQLTRLQPGDVVDIIHYSSTFEEEDDFEAYISSTITVTEDTVFTEESLPDGYYFMNYRLEDNQGNFTYTDYITVESVNGELFTHEAE